MKNRNVKIVYDIMLVTMGLSMAMNAIFLKKKDESTADLFFCIAIGSALAALIIRLIDKFFPRWSRNRPTRRELE